MIRIGQNFRFGFYERSVGERMRAIKEAGFDDTLLRWGSEFSDVDGDSRDLFDLATSLGLGIHTVHFPTVHADWFWYDDERGSSYLSLFESVVDDCCARGIDNIVVHTTKGTVNPPVCEAGLANFGRMLDKAQSCGVVIAVENTRFLSYNRALFDRFAGSVALGFCYDCGHHNCFTPSEDPLALFGSRLVTTHIHDNEGPGPGVRDVHFMMGDGIVDFDKVFSGLKALGCSTYNLESCCESNSIRYGKISMEDYLALSYERLVRQLERSGIEVRG